MFFGATCQHGFLDGFFTLLLGNETPLWDIRSLYVIVHKRIILDSEVQVETVSQLDSLMVLCMIKFLFQNGIMGQPIL